MQMAKNGRTSPYFFDFLKWEFSCSFSLEKGDYYVVGIMLCDAVRYGFGVR
jgi:hypothetical protein